MTKGRDELTARLQGIRGGSAVIVFDGRRGEAASEYGEDPHVVVTHGGDENGTDRETADSYIERELLASERGERLEVVTADRRLRMIAHRAKAKTINPAKFWRRYLPRLKGLKNDYRNEPKVPDGE